MVADASSVFLIVLDLDCRALGQEQGIAREGERVICGKPLRVLMRRKCKDLARQHIHQNPVA